MKGRLLIIVVAILVITMLSLAYYRPVRDPDAIPSGKAGVVTIKIANPYRFDIRLEVKCDWEWQKGKYRLHQFITVLGKRQTMIFVPNYLKSCEIWPKVIW